MSDTTTILHQHQGKIIFTVDDVTPPEARLATVPVHARLKEQIGQPLQTSSHNGEFRVIEECPYHPLISAVHLAFSRHYSLALTPDTIWIAVAQGLAQHINNHAEALRFRVVRHEGKKTLEAKQFVLEQPEHWTDVIEQWSHAIRAQVGEELHNLLICNFSTSTPAIQTASQVVMMDAFRQYFDYYLKIICGIPQITLYGTVEDWLVLRDRVRRLADYDLSWWTRRLLPLCDAFVETADGKPSRSFWQSIYMPKPTYGGGKVTGWLGDFFPYVNDFLTKAPVVRNPLLDRPRTAWIVEDGLFPDSFPNGLSHVPATLHIVGSGERRDLSFVGGFLGATQDSSSGCIGVEIGWAVHERDDFEAALDTIVRDHETGPPLPHITASRRMDEVIPGELIQMLERFDGGRLFAGTDHPWNLRRFQNYTTLPLGYAGPRGMANQTITCFLDLADGRTVGYTYVYWMEDQGDGGRRWMRECWILIGRKGKGLIREELGTRTEGVGGLRGLFDRIREGKRRRRYVPRFVEREVDILLADETFVISKGLGPFFQRLLEADGAYFFDEIGAGCPPWNEASARLKFEL